MNFIKCKDLIILDGERKKIEENELKEKKTNADLILKNAQLQFELEKQRKGQADIILKLALLEKGGVQ